MEQSKRELAFDIAERRLQAVLTKCTREVDFVNRQLDELQRMRTAGEDPPECITPIEVGPEDYRTGRAAGLALKVTLGEIVKKLDGVESTIGVQVRSAYDRQKRGARRTVSGNRAG